MADIINIPIIGINNKDVNNIIKNKRWIKYFPRN
jgi:hypothetical protein